MSDEIEFPKGLMVKAPHENAPSFVKCSISIKRKELGNWLRGKTEDWINLDVKVSKDEKWYVAVNNWKPDKKESKQESKPSDDFDNEIPF